MNEHQSFLISCLVSINVALTGTQGTAVVCQNQLIFFLRTLQAPQNVVWKLAHTRGGKPVKNRSSGCRAHPNSLTDRVTLQWEPSSQAGDGDKNRLKAKAPSQNKAMWTELRSLCIHCILWARFQGENSKLRSCFSHVHFQAPDLVADPCNGQPRVTTAAPVNIKDTWEFCLVFRT